MITVAYPWVFLALPLPLLFRWILPKAKRQNSLGLKVPFFNELNQTFGKNQIDSNITKPGKLQLTKILWGLIWISLIASGSGIEWLGPPLPAPQSGRELMMAIDLSGSMQTPDMLQDGKNLSRIDLVKQVATKFIKERNGDRIGLVLFGSRPYLQTPLTFDRKTVEEMLNDATIGIAGPQTAIGDAIGLATKQLIDYPQGSKALILLTDGGNNAGVLDPIQAADLARRAHIKIYTIGLGAREMQLQTIFGTQTVNPSSDLDIEGLKKIATITGGQFFRAEDGAQLQTIYSQINQLEPIETDKVIIRPITPFYPWSLGLAIVLSFILVLIRVWRETK